MRGDGAAVLERRVADVQRLSQAWLSEVDDAALESAGADVRVVGRGRRGPGLGDVLGQVVTAAEARAVGGDDSDTHVRGGFPRAHRRDDLLPENGIERVALLWPVQRHPPYMRGGVVDEYE